MALTFKRSDFRFIPQDNGTYMVSYLDRLGRTFTGCVSDRELVSRVRNGDKPTQKDMAVIVRICKA